MWGCVGAHMRHDNYSVYNAERAQLQVINDVLAGQRRAAAHQSYNIINIVSTSDTTPHLLSLTTLGSIFFKFPKKAFDTD